SLANNSMPSWAGNVDQWNIDYVYLNKDRNMADSVYKDIAFVEPAPSSLANYYSMPWSQYCVDPDGEMKDTMYMTISNLDTVTYNSSYKYDVYDESWSVIYPYNGGSYNIYPYIDSSYQSYVPHAKPIVGFTFPCDTQDSASFRIVHVIKEGILGDSRRQNDTVFFDQKFYNYYAYDDGTPEAGYGLTPANSTLAYKFTLNHPDTLRAVKMFFNQTYNNASQQYFYLTVWDDASGYPNNIIYQQPGCKPQYADSLNTFHSYQISNTTLVLNGTFYVGWKQTTDDNLNLGFDKNTDVQSKIFYNTGSGWTNTIYHGALMIRPVLGNKLPEVASVDEINTTVNNLVVYPNPASGNGINVLLPSALNSETSSCTVSLYDMFGRKVFTAPYMQHLQLPDISDGIYILGVTSSTSHKAFYTRLSIVK
ncbi:MAG: T9SS type A sorting domain-containing protein, partial [Bacteroidota bacterium]